MKPSPSPRCTAALRALLGEDRVRVDDATLGRAGMNVTELAPRRLFGVLSVADRDEVCAVVAIAREHETPIVPLSTGRNWGVGSKLPVREGAWLLDLGAMNRIVEVNAASAYALVEPGVTQADLAAHLEIRKIPLVVDVTGAPGRTSLLGNALERGVTMRGQRSNALRGLEVVTGSGLVVRTGLWHYAEASARPYAHHYPAGLGPDLTGLFVQSSFGVATLASLALRHREPVALAVLRVKRSRLAALVDAIGVLRRRAIVGDRIEIDGDDDPRLDALARGSEGLFYAWIPLFGEADLTAPVRARIASTLTPLAENVRFCAKADDLPLPIRTRLARLEGCPDEDERDLDADLDARGFVCALPAVPLAGSAVAQVLDIIDVTATAAGVKAFASFNTVSADAFEGYVRVSFDRRDHDEVARAQRWCESAHDLLARHGYLPLRVDVDRLPAFVRADDDFWRAVAAIKRALDPEGIIAPGRYAP